MEFLGKWAPKLSRRTAGKLGSFLATAFVYVAGDSLGNLGEVHARTSTAAYTDSAGALQTAAIGVPRDKHFINGAQTLLLEVARTNSFLNSGVPATHTSPSLATGSYTLWLVGSGSIAVAAGTATITGAGTATAASPVTFTVTVAGTVTFTVTGSVTRAQCENGPFPSSYIATTGAAVTRQADTDTFPFPYVPQVMTMYVKFIEQGTILLTSFNRVIQIGDSTASARVLDIRVSSNKYAISHEVTGGASVGATAATAPVRGDTVELRAVLNADGSVLLGQSINGGAETVTAVSGAMALATTWAAPSLALNQAVGGGSAGFNAFVSTKIELGVHDLATMRAA